MANGLCSDIVIFRGEGDLLDCLSEVMLVVHTCSLTMLHLLSSPSHFSESQAALHVNLSAINLLFVSFHVIVTRKKRT